MNAFPLFVFASCAVVAASGCGSALKYRTAERAPAARLLNRPFSPSPVSASLATVIVYGGPGSWKRAAWWDEYVVWLKNPGFESVTLVAAELEDFSGAVRSPESNPWILEKKSAALAKEFRRNGVAFTKEALPVSLTAGLAVGYSASAGSALRIVPSVFEDGEAVGPAGLASGQGIVALSRVAGFAQIPVLLAERVLANREDRSDIEAEFNLRRLVLPITLARGQARAGCFFFPMGPSPRVLRLRWQRGDEGGTIELPLEFLRGLHVPTPGLAAAR